MSVATSRSSSCSIAESAAVRGASAATSPICTARWRSNSCPTAASAVWKAVTSTLTPLTVTVVISRHPLAGAHQLVGTKQVSDCGKTTPDVHEPSEWKDQKDRESEHDMKLVWPGDIGQVLSSPRAEDEGTLGP